MLSRLREITIIFAAIGFFGIVLAEDSNITNNTTQNITSTATNTNNNTNVNQSTSTSTNTNFNTNSSTINQTTNSTNTSVSTINNTQNVTSNITQDQNIVNSTTTNNTNNSVVSQTSDSNVVSNNTNNNFSTSSSTVNTNNVNQNNSQNVNQNTNINQSNSRQVVTQKLKGQVQNSAIAPSITNYNSVVCRYGNSVGIQTQILGFASGRSEIDKNCELILLSRELAAQGLKVASVALLCSDPRVFAAMTDFANTPCPVVVNGKGLIGSEALAYWKANPEKRPDWHLIKHEYDHKKYDVKAYKKKDFCKKFPTHKLCSG